MSHNVGETGIDLEVTKINMLRRNNEEVEQVPHTFEYTKMYPGLLQ